MVVPAEAKSTGAASFVIVGGPAADVPRDAVAPATTRAVSTPALVILAESHEHDTPQRWHTERNEMERQFANLADLRVNNRGVDDAIPIRI